MTIGLAQVMAVPKVAVAVKKHKQVSNTAIALRPSVAAPALSELASTAILPADPCFTSTLQQYSWNWRTMLAIEKAESGCNADAINYANSDGIPDFGILQLHSQDIMDPVQNIAAAYKLWKTQSYEAWSTFDSGKYLQYE